MILFIIFVTLFSLVGCGLKNDDYENADNKRYKTIDYIEYSYKHDDHFYAIVKDITTDIVYQIDVSDYRRTSMCPIYNKDGIPMHSDEYLESKKQLEDD